MNPDRFSKSNHPGLYVHIPFCGSICPYCDFAVLTGDRSRQERFVSHLRREIDLADEEIRDFDTVYFGGGTPSFLYAEGLSEIANAIVNKGEKSWLAPGCQWFLEANPEDVEASSLSVWRELGIRTLSLGVQALDDEALPWLGRHHTVEDVRRSVRLAREAGFDELSVDLIYGPSGTGDRRLAKRARGGRRFSARSSVLLPADDSRPDPLWTQEKGRGGHGGFGG